MITNKDVEKATGLTRQGVIYRLKQMFANGEGIEPEYKQSGSGVVRVYTEADLQAIINYKVKKPGRKTKNE